MDILRIETNNIMKWKHAFDSDQQNFNVNFVL